MKWILIFVFIICIACGLRNKIELSKLQAESSVLMQQIQSSYSAAPTNTNSMVTDKNLIVQGLYNLALVSDLFVQNIQVSTGEHNCNLTAKMHGEFIQLMQYFRRINAKNFIYKITKLSIESNEEGGYTVNLGLQINGYLNSQAMQTKLATKEIPSSFQLEQLMLKGYVKYRQQTHPIVGTPTGESFVAQQNHLLGKDNIQVLTINSREIILAQGKKRIYILCSGGEK